jgi:hypothetical protein
MSTDVGNQAAVDRAAQAAYQAKAESDAAKILYQSDFSRTGQPSLSHIIPEGGVSMTPAQWVASTNTQIAAAGINLSSIQTDLGWRTITGLHWQEVL